MSTIFSTEAINTFRINSYVQYVPSLSSNMVAAIFTPPFIFTGVILYRVYLILLFYKINLQSAFEFDI